MKTLALSLGCLLLLGLTVHTGERLTLKITPPVAVAPAGLVVRTTIETSPDNRALEVVASSPGYYRSSEMSLDGARSPRVNEWVFRGLPAGRYEITATLVGRNGDRATASRWFEAAAGPGDR
jgi:hypothetical protein